MDLNKLGKRYYSWAVRKGEIHEGLDDAAANAEMKEGIDKEVGELQIASESETADYLGYTEVEEGLADIILVSLAELYRRKADIEVLLHRKMKYNEQH